MPGSERLTRSMRVAADLIVNLLVDGEFQLVENMTGGLHLSAADLEEQLQRAAGTLIRPPVSSYEQLVFRKVVDSEPFAFETQVPLWTSEHGRTNTALVLRFREAVSETVQPEVIAVASTSD